MKEIVVADEMKELAAQAEDWFKRDLGRIDLDGKFSDVTDILDRRRVGKRQCQFCGHKFNPYYAKTLIQGNWDLVWHGDSHKEPESKCEVKCPKCNEQLYFVQYIGQ